MDDPRVARSPGARDSTPDQLALTIGAGGAVVAHWATGTHRMLEGDVVDKRPPPRSDGAVVQHGASRGKLDVTDKETAAPTRYTQRYKMATYQSPEFHHVTLKGLVPGERRFYRVGSKSGGWSDVRSFIAPPSVANDASDAAGSVSLPAGLYPYRLAVVGDSGQTYNTSTTFDHMVASDPAAILHLGDFVYADLYDPVGGYDADPLTTHQPRWDAFGRFVSPMASASPMITVVGNHERETDEAESEWLSYTARYDPPGGSKGYYSTRVGPVHVVVINTYASDVAAMRA